VTVSVKAGSEPLLRRLMAFVGTPDRPLTTVNASGARGATIASRKIVEDLATHGIVPRKTWSLRISADATAQPAFWLGELDGDGSVGISRGGCPKIRFVGTRALMSQCADFVAIVVGRKPAVYRYASGQEVLWSVAVSGDNAKQLAEVLLAAHYPSLEEKRVRLRAASEYESVKTRIRAGAGRTECSWCGAPIERAPSQVLRHAFCDRSHYRAWCKTARRGMGHGSHDPNCGNQRRS
jgi:hypothetical protein